MKRFLLPALLSALMIAEVHAESFTVSDIRVNGLQRVSAGSVFAALPLNVGETIDDQALVRPPAPCSRPVSSRTSSSAAMATCW